MGRLKYLSGSLGQYTWAGHSVMVLSYPTHFWREGFTTFALSFLLFNNGASIGWSSPALPSFEADQDFSDKIGENIAAWIGALICLTSCGGNILTPTLTTYLGPKKTLLFIALPCFTTSWAFILLARPLAAVWILLLARGIAGFAVGVCVSIIPSYIIDIASPEYQGLFALGPQLMISIGLLFVYVLGAVVDWWWLSLVCLTLQLPMFALLILTPDSPSSLLQRGKEEESRDAVFWLTQSKSVAEHKVDKMIEVSCSGKESAKKSLISILPLLKKPSNWKPLCISVSILVALQLCGISPLVFFSVKFFQDAETSVDASLSSIIVASITLITVVLVCLFGANASRRKLMLASQFGLSFCLFVMALYFFLGDMDMADSIRWLPLLILVLYFIFFNIGLSSLIWVITAEILPTEIREQIIPFAILISSILWFLVTFFFHSMFVTFGGLYLFLFYAVISLILSFVSFFFLPETSGKTQEEISQFFKECSFGCVK